MKFKDMPYKRINQYKVETDLRNLRVAFEKAKSGQEQLDIHKQYYMVINEVETMAILAKIRHEVDMTDEYYSKENEFYDELMPVYHNLVVAYQRAVYESPFRAFLEEKIGKVAFRNIEISMKANDEKLIPLQQEENALVTEYNKVIAGAKIEWEGETLNLSLLKKYMSNPDKEIRRRAYAKSSAFFCSVEDKLDDIFDRLVKNRTKQAKLLGYQDYVTLGYYKMNRNCYDRKMVENFREQVKKTLVPYAQSLFEKQRVRLGLDKLTYMDTSVFFKEGNPSPSGSPSDVLQAGKTMYAKLSPETKEFFDLLMENQLFDVLGRKTKKAGGYMGRIPNYRVPFIFANFNGTSGDVDVMTHECGHAFQGYLAMQDPIQEHWDITMETAEIHSMTMEFFTYPWMKLFFGDRAGDYFNMHLESAVTFIPYGCMVDEFQHIVYENPEMTPSERKEAWSKLEKIYEPHRAYEGDAYLKRGGYWQRQLHIFNYPFYYIDYCLARTCALQYKLQIDQNFEQAWESYVSLCRLSAKEFFTEIIKKSGLHSPFEEGCIEEIVKKLEVSMQ